MEEKEICENCKHCVPCKHLRDGAWWWFKICKLFADEKDGWCITVERGDMCECFERRADNG